jgi:hypothetical protein
MFLKLENPCFNLDVTQSEQKPLSGHGQMVLQQAGIHARALGLEWQRVGQSIAGHAFAEHIEASPSQIQQIATDVCEHFTVAAAQEWVTQQQGHCPEDAEVVIVAPERPVDYPLDAWEKTLYAEFAERVCKNTFMPREFGIEAIATVTGSIVGDRLRTDRKGGNARKYTALVGLPGRGKGEQVREALDLVRPPEDWSPLDNVADEYFLHRGQSRRKHIGTFESNASSEPALGADFCKSPRVLFVPTELDQLTGKLDTPGAGSSLKSLIRECFDSTWPKFSTTKSRKQSDVPQWPVNLSILTSTQPETAEQLMVTLGQGTGLIQRFTWVLSDEARTVASLPVPQFGDLPKRLFEKIAPLEQEPLIIKVTPAADAVLKEWWSKVSTASDNAEVTGRLNVLALRNALHIAWMLDSGEITAEHMAKACRLGDYQLSVRKRLVTPPVRNDVALWQARIKKALQEKGTMTQSALYKATNANRCGTQIFEAALRGLFRLGQIFQVQGDRRNTFEYALRAETE